MESPAAGNSRFAHERCVWKRWDQSVSLKTTHANCSRSAFAEEGTASNNAAHRNLERHQPVSNLQGAHEDDSWRFSVGVAAQAAPSKPAISNVEIIPSRRRRTAKSTRANK
jgi:hypothetical protein